MIEINGTAYYTKAEICERLNMTAATLNARIVATKVNGHYFGKKKHYTEAEIETLALYRKR